MTEVQDQQPTGAAPSGGCPPGLEYLAQIDEILIQQQVELLEAFTGFETNNKYTVTNSLGQQAYFVAEETGVCTRQCLGNLRPFELYMYDNHQTEVMHMSRPCKCGCCWGPASNFHVMTVTSPGSGAVLGTVRQTRSFWKAAYALDDPNGDQVLTVTGRCCPCGCGDVPFIVWSNDGQEVGRITKKFRGCLMECCTRADTFNASFPLDLDVNVKATVIATAFLIDFMYFEQSN